MEYKYICYKCNFKCNYNSYWEKHINTELHKTGKKKERSDKIGLHKCKKCEYSTINIITMKQHYLNIHSTYEEREKGFKYFCKICNYGIFSKELFEKHENTTKHKYKMIIETK